MEVAVIKTGGKQYVVQKGDSIFVEKLPAKAAPNGSPEREDLKAGDSVTFSDVLLVDNGSDTTIGAPFVKGAKVTGVIERAGRAKKVDVVKYKPKSRYFKRRGHRQSYLKVKITEIA